VAKKKKVAKPARPKRAVNLNTDQGRTRYVDSYEKNVINEGWKKEDPYDCYSRLPDFLKTLDQPMLRWDKWPLFVCPNDDVVVLKDRVLYYIDSRPEDLTSTSISGVDVPEGVLMTSCKKRTKECKGFRAIVLCNGDEDVQQPFLDRISEFTFPTISFDCLARFYYKNTAKGSTFNAQRKVYEDMVRRLAKGDIELLDYTPDETKPLRPNDKKALSKIRRKAKKDHPEDDCEFNEYVREEASRIRPPAPGFNLLKLYDSRYTQWHRIGTALLRDGDMHILMGRDDETYFGCELGEACTNITEAITSLTPEAARQSAYFRQGEWFMVPMSDKQLPELQDRALEFDCGSLPLDDPDGNEHGLNCNNGFVGKDGVVYVFNGKLTHDEHPDLETKGWCSIHRNTAKRSFSAEGVD